MLLGEKNPKQTWKYVRSVKCLGASSVQEVWSKLSRCKLSRWSCRLCSVLHWCWTFFQLLKNQEFLSGPRQILGWFWWQCRLPSWFLRNWTRRHKSGTRLQVVTGVLEHPGLPSELSVPRGSRSPKDAHLPISCTSEEREGSPNPNYLKSAKYRNVRTLDFNPWFCISYLSYSNQSQV